MTTYIIKFIFGCFAGWYLGKHMQEGNLAGVIGMIFVIILLITNNW